MTEYIIDGVTFTPVTQLSRSIHPLALSFVLILDVPLYLRTDSAVRGLASYYADEKILLRMLKPVVQRRSSTLHGLDSMRSLGGEDDEDSPSHFSSVHRTLLFTGMTAEERRTLEQRWDMAHRQITVLSLSFFHAYLTTLRDHMIASIDKSVSDKFKSVLLIWHARQDTSHRVSLRAFLDRCQASPLWTHTPMYIDLTSLSTYISFTDWWDQLKRTALLRNYEASSLGLCLRWLDTVASNLLREDQSIGDAWDAVATRPQDENWTGGALWTTCSSEVQNNVRQQGLAHFAEWYNTTTRDVITGKIHLPPSDGADTTILIPRRKEG